jgi:CubicO group peptidase (beta-lactamase class C family)
LNHFGQEPKLQNVQSVTKSICALAIASLIDHGAIASVDEPMTNWIPVWSKDQQGHEATGGGLSLFTPDLSKIGLMMLARGVYKGNRIISEWAHALLLTKSQSYKDYGLLWWLHAPREGSADQFNVFNAAGWGGQYIVVRR